ncbi:MAG: hypothetical protein K6D38_11585 [Pseudobutyrivibrio sp.]|nr:hypothetical protein [Pseudobutyrivibrio sp.]
MENTNQTPNENQAPNVFDEEAEKKMEKQVKLSFIASICLIIVALLGTYYASIITLLLAAFNVNALKVERFKKDATRNLILLGISFLIAIIKIITR